MFTTLIIFILVLSILVFAHELGHFWTARKFGAKVEEFGFGLPPRIFGFRKKDGRTEWIWGKKEVEEDSPTVYSLNWFPIGGFVKIRGENGEERDQDDSFGAKPIWQRVIMLSAGVAMNFFLCVVFLAIGFWVGLPAVVDDTSKGAVVTSGEIRVVESFENLPASEAGIASGDIIYSVDGVEVNTISAVQKIMAPKLDQEVRVVYKRGDKEFDKMIKVEDYDKSIGIGVSLVETGVVRYPWYWAIWQGFKMTCIWLVTIIVAFAVIIKNLIVGAPVGVDVAGPVGIAVMTGQATQLGWVYLMQFTALLSINLAIINFLPFPALDGGRVLFLIIEKIRKKPVKQEIENLIHNIGFMLLMLLIIVVTYRDVIKYGGKLWGKIVGLF